MEELDKSLMSRANKLARLPELVDSHVHYLRGEMGAAHYFKRMVDAQIDMLSALTGEADVDEC